MHSYPYMTSPKSHPNRSFGGVLSWRAFNIGTYPMDKIGRCLGSQSCCRIAWIVNDTFIDVSAFSIDSYWVLITNTVVSRFFIDTNFWRATIMSLSKTLLYMGSHSHNKPNRAVWLTPCEKPCSCMSTHSMTPSPVYPSEQVQSNPSSRFKQSALTWQLWSLRSHSSSAEF